MGFVDHITEEHVPLLSEEEYSNKLCGCGSGLKVSKNKRPRNTSYHEEEKNWLNPCCDYCFVEDYNYYAELWKEYYHGCF
jgi:hypothetical protein